MREKIGEDVPILIISAYDWGSIEAEARAAGVSGFLSKPLFKSTLYYGLSRFKEGAEAKNEADQEAGADYTGRRLLVAEAASRIASIFSLLIRDRPARV